jgi:DNA-3-methyladenine glycosylase II
LVGGSAPHAVAAVLEALGPERGMLYYHLLLARLEAGGGLGSVAAGAHQSTWRSGA